MSYHNTGRNLTQNKAAPGNGLTYSKGTNNRVSTNPNALEIYQAGAVMANRNNNTAQLTDTALDIALRALR